MDGSQCPSGLYTDRAFQRAPLTECGTSMWVYWVTTMTVCILRFVAFFKKIDNYVKRVQPGSQPKYPFGLAAHLFAACMYIVVSITVGLNVGNVDNGISFSLYSLAYVSFIINYSILLVRTVRLGKRLIPKTAEITSNELSFLSRFNVLGLILIGLQSLSAVVSCIALVILSPLMPSEDILLGVIGFATKGIFQLLCIFGIVMQFQRCIAALDRFRSQMSQTHTMGDHEQQLYRTILMMRQRQATIFTIGTGVSIIYLLFAAQAVPWTWSWIILGTAGFETFGSLILEFCFASGSKRSNKDQSNTGSVQRVAFPKTREDTQIVPPSAFSSAAKTERLQHAPILQGVAVEKEDEVSELPSIEAQTRSPMRQSRLKIKRGPMGFRMKRKPKLEIDLTRVTEEQTYVSSMNPRASATVLRASLSRDFSSSDMNKQSNENKNSSEKV